MKVALCFLISYKHILNKEEIWKKWIEPNQDIINVYFHYKKLSLIKSKWIKKNCIPENKIFPTSYFHVVPAYISILNYAYYNDLENKWFCLLSESCVPIISSQQFRILFFKKYNLSIFKWRPAYWNVNFHFRANLHLLKSDFHLANDPWFVLTREHVFQCIIFLIKKNNIYKTVCKGGLANESLFAIILHSFENISTNKKIINNSSTLADWNRMSSPTSPYLFNNGNNKDIKFITEELKKNEDVIFLRKVSPFFPNEIILNFIKNKNICYNFNYYILFLFLIYLYMVFHFFV